MIDISRERLLRLSEVPAEVPGQPHPSTVVRWWRVGVRGVKLETILIGGRRFTSVEAIERFIGARNEAS